MTADPTSDPAALAAIASPIDRARQITLVGRRHGNLPPHLARLRDAALYEACVTDGRKHIWVAHQVGLTPSRVSRIVRRALAALAPTEGAQA